MTTGTPRSRGFLVTPPDSRLRHTSWPSARRSRHLAIGRSSIRSTRPATDGLYKSPISRPAPTSWPAVDAWKWRTWPLDFLETLATAGIPLTLGEGEKKRQDLKMAR